jgi:hypothetical protein
MFEKVANNEHVRGGTKRQLHPIYIKAQRSPI